MEYVEVKNEFKRYKMGETTITANEDLSPLKKVNW